MRSSRFSSLSRLLLAPPRACRPWRAPRQARRSRVLPPRPRRAPSGSAHLLAQEVLALAFVHRALRLVADLAARAAAPRCRCASLLRARVSIARRASTSLEDRLLLLRRDVHEGRDHVGEQRRRARCPAPRRRAPPASAAGARAPRAPAPCSWRKRASISGVAASGSASARLGRRGTASLEQLDHAEAPLAPARRRGARRRAREVAHDRRAAVPTVVQVPVAGLRRLVPLQHDADAAFCVRPPPARRLSRRRAAHRSRVTSPPGKRSRLRVGNRTSASRGNVRQCRCPFGAAASAGGLGIVRFRSLCVSSRRHQRELRNVRCRQPCISSRCSIS